MHLLKNKDILVSLRCQYNIYIIALKSLKSYKVLNKFIFENSYDLLSYLLISADTNFVKSLMETEKINLKDCSLPGKLQKTFSSNVEE